MPSEKNYYPIMILSYSANFVNEKMKNSCFYPHTSRE